MTRRSSRFYRVAWAFYLVLALGGLVGLAAQGVVVAPRLLVDPASWWLDLGWGLAAGATLLAAWLAARRLLAPARGLERVMARLLGRTTRQEVVALALISALAEEVVFRGALQHAIGWVGAAVVFALLHVGPRAPFLLWSLFALLGGLVFGWIMELRQALVGPIVGHLMVNLVQLRRLSEAHGEDTAYLIPDE